MATSIEYWAISVELYYIAVKNGTKDELNNYLTKDEIEYLDTLFN